MQESILLSVPHAGAVFVTAHERWRPLSYATRPLQNRPPERLRWHPPDSSTGTWERIGE